MERKESCGIMAIDLKSFYASCECVERGLDPEERDFFKWLRG